MKKKKHIPVWLRKTSLLLAIVMLFFAAIPIMAEPVHASYHSFVSDSDDYNTVYNGVTGLETDSNSEEPDEEPNFFEEMVAKFLISIADLIYFIEYENNFVVDRMVLGRVHNQVSVNYFGFDLADGNVFGSIGAFVYAILRNFIFGLMGIYFMYMLVRYMFNGTGQERSHLKENLYSFIFAFMLLYAIPILVDIVILFRDSLIKMAMDSFSTIFGFNSLRIVDNFETAAQDLRVVNAFIYLTAVCSAIPIALSYLRMAALNAFYFGCSPAVIFRSFSDKQILSRWTSTFITTLFVPLIDLCGLLMAMVLIDADFAIIALLIIFLIVPARNGILRLFGAPLPGRNGLGLGMVLAASRLFSGGGRNGGKTSGNCIGDSNSEDGGNGGSGGSRTPITGPGGTDSVNTGFGGSSPSGSYDDNQSISSDNEGIHSNSNDSYTDSDSSGGNMGEPIHGADADYEGSNGGDTYDEPIYDDSNSISGNDIGDYGSASDNDIEEPIQSGDSATVPGNDVGDYGSVSDNDIGEPIQSGNSDTVSGNGIEEPIQSGDGNTVSGDSIGEVNGASGNSVELTDVSGNSIPQNNAIVREDTPGLQHGSSNTPAPDNSIVSENGMSVSENGISGDGGIEHGGGGGIHPISDGRYSGGQRVSADGSAQHMAHPASGSADLENARSVVADARRVASANTGINSPVNGITAPTVREALDNKVVHTAGKVAKATAITGAKAAVVGGAVAVGTAATAMSDDGAPTGAIMGALAGNEAVNLGAKVANPVVNAARNVSKTMAAKTPVSSVPSEVTVRNLAQSGGSGGGTTLNFNNSTIENFEYVKNTSGEYTRKDVDSKKQQVENWSREKVDKQTDSHRGNRKNSQFSGAGSEQDE